MIRYLIKLVTKQFLQTDTAYAQRWLNTPRRF
jgi:hypothetical protein